MARWPFVSLGRYSRHLLPTLTEQPQTGTVADNGSHQENTEILDPIFSIAYRFEPIAVDNLGVFSSTTVNFISEHGRRICVHTGDVRETSYRFQRISATLQRFNSLLLHNTLPVDLPDL